MRILNTAITQGSKLFNSKGCRLLKKIPDIPLSEMTDIILPEGTKGLMFAKIETDFGKGLTKVFSFFDKDGRLIERYIDKTSKGRFERIHSKYKGQFDWGFGRTKESVRTVNDVPVQNVNSRNYYDKYAKVLYREKLVRDINSNGKSIEYQTFENLAPHGKRQYIQTVARKNKQNQISSTEITTNFATQKELDEMQKFPYLYYLNYSDEDFVHAISPYAQKLQKVENRGVKVEIKELKEDTLGESYGELKEIAVDVTKGSSKGKLVNTTNHEYRHQYQHMIAEAYEQETQSLSKKIAASIERKKQKSKSWFRRILDKFIAKPSPKYAPLSPHEKEFAQKCSKDFKNYVSPEDNFDEYYNQFVEVDARLAGQIAQDEFELGKLKIERLFNNAQLDLKNWTKQQKDTCKFLRDKINSLFS
ncbi:hypothetical protein IJ541_02655 [bacterium]|nr:hypothetical protein [bacterium]